MIAEISTIKRVCNGDFTKIANYIEAINDYKHMWHLHHKLGLNHSINELKKANLYYNRPPEELEFLCAASKEEDIYGDLKTHSGIHAEAKKRIAAEFEFNALLNKLSRETCKDSSIVSNKLVFESWVQSLLAYERMTKRLDIEGLSVHTGLKESFIRELIDE